MSPELPHKKAGPPPSENIRKLALTLKASTDKHLLENASGFIYYVSAAIIREFLGIEFVEKYIIDKRALNKFFRPNIQSALDEGMLHIRTIHLAEMLYNLQTAPNFLKVKVMLKGGDVEAAFAELEVAKFLFCSGVPFRFRETGRGRGQDYDLDIKFNGTDVCADTKCKVEDTPRRDETLYNTLRSGRGGLPKDGFGMFFVKIPQTWDKDAFKYNIPMLERVTEEFFKTTRRVVSVKYFFSPVIVEEKYFIALNMFKEIDNPHVEGSRDLNWDMLSNMKTPPDWVDIVRICFSVLHET